MDVAHEKERSRFMCADEQRALQPLAEQAGRLAQVQEEQRQCLTGREGEKCRAASTRPLAVVAVLQQQEHNG